MVSVQLVEKILGLISTLILARLLLPDDFGLIAIATLVITFFSLFSQTGIHAYIVRKEILTDADVNSAWTLQLLLKAPIIPLALVAAPFVASFYEDNRLTGVISIIVFTTLLASFQNPAIYVRIREHDYSVTVKITISKKIAAVITTVILALVYKSYWALVGGYIASNLVGLFMSYYLISYRPKMTLGNFSEQWGFSKWVIIRDAVGFLKYQADLILVGRFYSMSEVGAYNVTKYISSIPTSHLFEPALSPLLASLSRARDNHEDLKFRVSLVLFVLISCSIPLAIFMYGYSFEITALLLGDKWLEYSNIFGLLSFLGVANLFFRIPADLLTMKGWVRYLFYFDFFALILVFSALFFARTFPVELFVLVKISLDIFLSLLLFILVGRMMKLKKVFVMHIGFSLLVLLFSLISLNASVLIKQLGLNIVLTIVLGVGLFGCILILLYACVYFFWLKKKREGIYFRSLFISTLSRLKY